MNPIWTLRDSLSLEQSAAAWGLCELTRHRVNQRADTVTFRAPARPSDADPLFAHGSTVRIFRAGLPWFYGRVVAVPSHAAAAADEQLYRLAGPWWYLENLVFQQIWQTTDGVTSTLVPTNKSRLILGHKSDGTKLATGDAIREVLAYALARGVPLAVGAITPAALAPYSEALDESCATVIRRLLRWTPDAIAAFDYSTAPFPTLSIRRRADAAPRLLPAYGPPITGLDLTPRHDLQVPAVVLKFEQTHDIDGESFITLNLQAAPPGATGDEFGAAVMTIELGGARASYQRQVVRTALIPTSDASAVTIGWWQEKFAWLRDFALADLQIAPGTQTRTIEHPENNPDVTLSQVPNELLEGAVKPWMQLPAAPLLVRATIKFIGTPTAASTEVFGSANQRDLFTRVIGTGAQTQTYRRLTSSVAAEPIPPDLAQALFDAAGVLAYDGTLAAVEPECSGLAQPGELLNLSGGRAEWLTMGAPIQRVEEELETGTTRVIVGPPHHLGATDLGALLRVNRQRVPATRREERTTGKATGNATTTDGGQQHPRSDSVFRPSAGGGPPALPQPFQLLDASDVAGLKVKVNPESRLQLSLDPTDTYAVSGLGTALAVTVGTRLWLALSFDPSGAITAATLGSGTGGWPGYPTPLAYSGTAPDQVPSAAYLLLGYLVAETSPRMGTVISGGPATAPVKAKIVQCVTAPLLLQNGSYNGLPALYPFPHHAPEVP